MNEAHPQTLQDAKKEPNFTAQSLIVELQAAINDYFYTQTRVVGNGLRLQFPNGQSFKITIKEEKND